MVNILEVKKLNVLVESKKVLKDIDLNLKKGEVLVIMGPNGSGKSSLAKTLMGHPNYKVSSGNIIFKEKNITKKKPEERAALGLFMSFQEPREISGLDFFPFLFDAYRSLQNLRQQEADDVFSFKPRLDKELASLKVSNDWSQRNLNEGFSGGEKKKSEILQMLLLKPDLVIFDEIDSGLDIDSLKVVGRAIQGFKTSETTIIIITHQEKILKYLQVDKVVVMDKGKVIKRGNRKLISDLEKQGFEKIVS